jgi:hypothetical protein
MCRIRGKGITVAVKAAAVVLVFLREWFRQFSVCDTSLNWFPTLTSGASGSLAKFFASVRRFAKERSFRPVLTELLIDVLHRVPKRYPK